MSGEIKETVISILALTVTGFLLIFAIIFALIFSLALMFKYRDEIRHLYKTGSSVVADGI